MTGQRIKIEDVTPQMLDMFGDNLCLIWSGEHSAWWRAGGAGYTGQFAAAGHYTIATAHAATKHCDPDKRIYFEAVVVCSQCGSNLVPVPA